MAKLLLTLAALALFGLSGATVCPGGRYTCPSDDTCCTTPSGLGCCPFPNANCCSDEVHCCPSGMTCDMQHGKCLGSNGESVEWMLKIKQSAPQDTLAKNISMGGHLCPDHRQTCPGGYTCCQLPAEDYGCCPFQNAVCCADKVHCCPEGQTCDLEQQRCTQGLTSMSKTEKTDVDSGNGYCPDHSYCPGSSSCCPIGGGHYGCCPLVAATCCSDLVHCCPHGTTCTAGGYCVRQGGKNTIPYIFKLR